MTTELKTVRVTRRFAASPERVFDAWLDPKRIRTWMLAPSQDDEILRIEIDARVGGAFSFVVRRQGQEIDHFGEYLEIDRPRRLAFTFDAVDAPRGAAKKDKSASIVSIDLVRVGSGTELTLTHEHVPAEYASRTESGWSTILDAIAASD